MPDATAQARSELGDEVVDNLIASFGDRPSQSILRWLIDRRKAGPATAAALAADDEDVLKHVADLLAANRDEVLAQVTAAETAQAEATTEQAKQYDDGLAALRLRHKPE